MNGGKAYVGLDTDIIYINLQWRFQELFFWWWVGGRAYQLLITLQKKNPQ